MKKYIFTESQLKRIIDNQVGVVNEQTTESYEGEIVNVSNGMAKVKATSEMGNVKYFTVKLRVNVPAGTLVYVEIRNGQPVIYGKDPRNPKGPNIKYN